MFIPRFLLTPDRLEDVHVDGILRIDYPDFVDCYLGAACIKIGPWIIELTDSQLEYITEAHREFVQQAAREQIM
jgi:hypothetical protein